VNRSTWLKDKTTITDVTGNGAGPARRRLRASRLSGEQLTVACGD
jgi:hypothetical protein